MSLNRKCNVVNIERDNTLPNGFWQVGYGVPAEEMFGLMAFRAESYEDAKNKFFNYTKDQFDSYDWPVTGP